MNPDSERVLTRRRLLTALGSGTGVALAGCEAPTAPTPTSTPRDAPPGSPDGPGDAPPESPNGRAARLDKYPRMEVGSVSELARGDVSTFAYPLNGQQNFLTRLSEGAWGGVGPDDAIVAYSTVCTHMGCSIGGSVDTDRATAGPCPCHYTSFDISKGGLTVVGPATTDLPQIELEVDGGTIYATGVDGLMYGYRNNLRDGDPVVGGDGTAPESSGDSDESTRFGGWFDDVDNYDGTVVDRMGQDNVTVAVGADGNGGTFAFDPAAVRVSTGTAVTFEWVSDTHNVLVESQPDGAGWDGHDTIENDGFSFSQTFETAGTYRYYCDPHLSLGMKGAIVVE